MTYPSVVRTERNSQSFGLDHRAMDVALDPASAAGRALIGHLRQADSVHRLQDSRLVPPRVRIFTSAGRPRVGHRAKAQLN
jgi:hypothetical protein